RESYDCIVLGVGGFGSGALYHVARRGVRALGIERFSVAHDRGSSHGETRIIRKAYFEHPDYVPLLHRAYDLWHELERETKRRLLHPVGLFIAGAPACESVRGTVLAAERHSLPIERLSARAARRRFSGFQFDDDFEIVFEPQAGYLEVENCVAAHVEAAVRHGAVVHTNERVAAWESDGRGVLVKTDKGEYTATSLIITAGPWAGEVLKACAGPDSPAVWGKLLRVVRKPVFWFNAGAEYEVAAGTPTFFFETAAGQFYGFPRIDGRTIKVAEHTGGDDVADPLAVDRTQHPGDLARLGEFLRLHLPAIAPTPARHSVCMYTRTPDSHFYIDRHPQWENVAVGAGFSGHGFKFTTVLGEALADVALEGATNLPVEFLSLKRLQ
ncbi:MAG: N-methyl-L-tryptophan oxidase, partial [Deltaproteobacteria bacterium]